VVASSFTFTGYAQYGFSDRLQAEIQMPYTNQRQSQTVLFEVPRLDSAFVQYWRTKSVGFGDLDMTVAYQLLAPAARKSFLGIFITTTLPTGRKNPTDIDPKNPRNYSRPTGSGEVAVLTQFKYRKIMYPFSYNLFISYKTYFGGSKVLDPEDTKEKPFKSSNYFSTSGSFNMHLNNWIVFKNFLDTYFFGPGETDGKEGQSSWALYYYPGFSFQLKRFRLDQTIVIPLAGKLTGADISYAIACQYTF
jgi:hypothetical protein